MRNKYQEDIDEIRHEEVDILAHLDALIEIVPEVETEFIERVNYYWQISEKTGWAIGGMFKRREDIIMRNYETWRKTHKSKFDEPPVGSLLEWFNLHKEDMRMSYDQARNCMRLFQGTTKEIGEALGTKKFKIISGLPPAKREKLIQETVVKGYSSEQVKARVAEEKQRLQDREQAQINYEREVKPKLPAVSFVMDGSKVISKCDSGMDAEALFQYLSIHAETIKRYIYNYKNRR